jgi:hypothetical protein
VQMDRSKWAKQEECHATASEEARIWISAKIYICIGAYVENLLCNIIDTVPATT